MLAEHFCASRTQKGHPTNGVRQRRLFGIVAAALLCLSCAAVGRAETEGHGPVRLDSRQLDQVTAGGTEVGLDLSATAAGPTALTSTQGVARQAQGNLLYVNDFPDSPRPRAPQVVKTLQADLFFAAGTATASGAQADCSASTSVTGPYVFLRQNALQTTAINQSTGITTNTCLCAAFAINANLPTVATR